MEELFELCTKNIHRNFLSSPKFGRFTRGVHRDVRGSGSTGACTRRD